MENLLEILKYTLPSALVILIADAEQLYQQ